MYSYTCAFLLSNGMLYPYHTSKRGCQFILSILQEVQAYIEDKTGFGSLALFICLNLKIINRTDMAVKCIKKTILMNDYLNDVLEALSNVAPEYYEWIDAVKFSIFE